MTLRSCSLFVLAFSFIAGCTAQKASNADEYFAMASENFQRGALELATTQYRELLDQYPFSDYTEEAEFKIAHAQYLQDKCPEAVSSLSDFQRRHPTSAHLAMVGYLLARCYERQMRPPDRDQSASQHAHAYYLALMQQHPESPFARLASEQMDLCRESMAKHELLVARFYRKRGNVKATEYRLLDLVGRFENTDVAAEALFALGDLYRDQGDDDRAALAFAGVTREHPEHELASKARKRLENLETASAVPDGDTVAVLKARAGRSRSLAITQAMDVPPLETAAPAPGLGPAFDPAGQGGPLGY